ncbi:MAG TPA: tRNA lysidine(34) synthetase TilS [Gammaproteobacteria bacterium]|nr:tRNA lysidine(34) synthetase TilS [Gammaproteobacteria bacterium]
MPGAAIDPLQIRECLSGLHGVNRFLIGLSGGLDSCVLLHVLRQAPPAAELRAVHVNHGLRPAAGEWERFCADLCAGYGIKIDLLRVDGRPARGESPEAAARNARYDAIRNLMEPGDCLLTAHQRDDQAETLLLQLLRGSGPAGLAAMPRLVRFGNGWQLRPLLDFDRIDLHKYAIAAAIRWVEDDSNSDPAYDRNFLRSEVMPLLRSRWPALAQTVARAAAHQAEAVELLQVLGEQDHAEAVNPLRGTLSVTRLRLLPPARLHNVLRFWFKAQAALPPSSAVLRQIVGAINAADDRSPRVAWGRWEVRRYGEDLYLLDQVPPPAEEYVWRLRDGDFFIPELRLRLRLQQLLAAGVQLPEGTSTLYIRFRGGGERIRLRGRKHSHSLKKILQERAVPPWLRPRLPLLCDERGSVLAVLGLEPPLLMETGA